MNTSISRKNLIQGYFISDWMRYGLDLKGVDLLLFAYVFTMTIDGTIDYADSLEEIADKVGITRQTVSKKLRTLPGIVISTSQDNATGKAYIHNKYTFDTSVLYSMCEKCGSEILEDYNNTLKGIIMINFPERQEEVEECIDRIFEGYGNKDKAEQKVIHTSMMTSAHILDNMKDTELYNQTPIMSANSLEGIFHSIYILLTHTDTKSLVPLNHTLEGDFIKYLKNRGFLTNIVTTETPQKTKIPTQTQDTETNTEEPTEDKITITSSKVSDVATPTDMGVTFPTETSSKTDETKMIDSTNNTDNSSSKKDITTPKGNKLNVIRGQELADKCTGKGKGKQKNNSSANSSKSLIDTEPKKKGRKSKKEILFDKLQIINQGFVDMECDGDEAVLDILNRYAKKLTVNAPDSRHTITEEEDWLYLLKPYYNCPNNVIIDDAEQCASKAYKTNGFIVNKYKTIEAFKKIAENYVNSLPKYDEELLSNLYKYVEEVAYPQKLTESQVETLISSLDNYSTNELKIAYVHDSYQSNYRTWILSDENKKKFANIIDANKPTMAIDMDKKIEYISEFINTEYLCLVPNIREALTEYVNSDVGKTMSIADFKKNLKILLCYGPADDRDKVTCIQSATETQSSIFAREDFNKLNKMNKEHKGVEGYLRYRRRIRLSDCKVEYKNEFAKNKHLLTEAIINDIINGVVIS